MFDERETKLQEHEQNEMKQRIQHLKELLKQRKRAKQDEGVTERIEDDPAVTEGEVENNFVNTDSDEDWVLNWKRKKRLEG